jgi:hypothetical protein
MFDVIRNNFFVYYTTIDSIQPHFIETNMNKTEERIIDEIADGHDTMILKCFAKGMPKPTVTWYKVGIISLYL